MDGQRIRSILQEALEDEVPSKSIRLWPQVKAGFVAGNKQQRKTMNTTPRRIASTVVAISILFAIVLLTPQGRALAQRMFQFFTVTEEKTFQIPTDQVSPGPETLTSPTAQILPVEPAQLSESIPTASPDASCSLPASKSTYYCQVKTAEAHAGFNAKEFLNDPKGLRFSSVTSLPNPAEIDMEFEVSTGGGYLYLRQGVSSSQEQTDDWGKVPTDAVEQVSVNGQYAEFVSGGFVVYPNATEAIWEPGGRLILAWNDGDRWFTLEKMGDPYPIEWITKDQLIKLAEELVDERPADMVPPLDPEYLTTAEQAEALAGFDIPTPSMLPAGYELKRVVWANNVARLMYGPKGSSESELFIFMGKIVNNKVGPCSECPPGTTETAQIGLWQGWYWRGIYQSSASYEAGQPTPTPVWDGNAPHWSLAWNSDTFWFSMIYSPAYNSGKETNKETLITIAESLK